MIPGPFDYHRPSSLDEAVGLLADLGDEALVLAGGHSLVPMMKLRLAQPEHLIDLGRVDSLRGIAEEAGELVIGAMTTQQDLIGSELLAGKCPILRETAVLIADPQVRARGTVGGNLANGDPGNDLPAVMLCLDARYRLQGPDGSRDVAAREFYEAAYFTARADNEIMTSVHVPLPPAGQGQAYEKLKRKVGDYATAAAAVALTFEGGNCTGAAIALTNLGDTPLLAEAAGAALVGTSLDAATVDRAVALAEEITDPAADDRGPADYRTKMAGVMTRRAIGRAKARAGAAE